MSYAEFEKPEDERDPTGEELLEDGEISPEEEAFMKGYSEEEEVPVCEECRMAIRKNPVFKTIGGEKHQFCSEECAEEYADSLGEQ